MLNPLTLTEGAKPGEKDEKDVEEEEEEEDDDEGERGGEAEEELVSGAFVQSGSVSGSVSQKTRVTREGKPGTMAS